MGGEEQKRFKGRRSEGAYGEEESESKTSLSIRRFDIDMILI